MTVANLSSTIIWRHCRKEKARSTSASRPARASKPNVTGASAAQWLVEKNQRIHGTNHKRPVDLLEKEQQYLFPLPPHPYDIALPKPVHSDSQAFVRFETNLYSVPAEVGGKVVTLKATPYQVDIYHENIQLATHKRSFARHNHNIRLREIDMSRYRINRDNDNE